jgi:NAD-dependent DNA ligase
MWTVAAKYRASYAQAKEQQVLIRVSRSGNEHLPDHLNPAVAD